MSANVGEMFYYGEVPWHGKGKNVVVRRVSIQYMREDGWVRTMKLQTAQGARQPWRIWTFNKMKQEHEKGGICLNEGYH